MSDAFDVTLGQLTCKTSLYCASVKKLVLKHLFSVTVAAFDFI